MSPHHTYLFLGFAEVMCWREMEVDKAPFFMHRSTSSRFALNKWAEVWEKQQLTQALSDEAPREPKAKRKHS